MTPDSDRVVELQAEVDHLRDERADLRDELADAREVIKELESKLSLSVNPT